MTLWFDVEDLVVFFQYQSRPTGIQRLSFEIYRELWKLGGPASEVRFCRHGATDAEYFAVDWPELEAGILAASAAGLQDAANAGDPGAEPSSRMEKAIELAADLPDMPEPEPPRLAEPAAVQLNYKGKIFHYLHPRITPTVRMPLGVILRSQKRSATALRDLLKALVLAAVRPSRPLSKLGHLTIRLSTEPAVFAADDFFVSLGASWGLLNAAAGRALQKQYGLRFAVLIHDLIPELYPEWTSREGLPAYRAWLRHVVPHANVIFAYSQNTAKDVVQRMALWNKKVPVPVILPVGHRPPPRRAPGEVAARPFDRPYVLFVSTIEVRKNHALLFRVWRRLLESLPAEQVPYLVFAGKTAWLTGDLLVQMANANWLDGHIKLIKSPPEPELMALYEHCEFTVYPSLYEGWGLPVTESLSFGKTVAASNRAAIPEAGGAFCTYFDPENVADAYAVICGLIEHPEQVRALEARIAESFRPPAWADTAAALVASLRAAGETGGAGGTKIRVAA